MKQRAYADDGDSAGAAEWRRVMKCRVRGAEAAAFTQMTADSNCCLNCFELKMVIRNM